MIEYLLFIGVGGSTLTSSGTGLAGVRSSLKPGSVGGDSLELLEPELDKCASEPLSEVMLHITSRGVEVYCEVIRYNVQEILSRLVLLLFKSDQKVMFYTGNHDFKPRCDKLSYHLINDENVIGLWPSLPNL